MDPDFVLGSLDVFADLLDLLCTCVGAVHLLDRVWPDQPVKDLVLNGSRIPCYHKL